MPIELGDGLTHSCFQSSDRCALGSRLRSGWGTAPSSGQNRSPNHAPSREQSPVGKRGGAPAEGQAKPKTTVKTRISPHPKNQRKFWAVLIYSRVMTWGKDFKNVAKYILQNTLEALFIITYRPRKNTKIKEIAIGRRRSMPDDKRRFVWDS
jgi:hypothetical protein